MSQAEHATLLAPSFFDADVATTLPDSDALEQGLTIERVFSKQGENAFDSVVWHRRDAAIRNPKGEAIFEQKGVEFPTSWSVLASNVVASKYFYGDLTKAGLDPDEGGREHSLRQLIHRVTRTLADWGLAQGYFATAADGERFYDELTWLCTNQYGAFNSPVWFNVGLHHQYGVRDTGGKTIYGWDHERNKVVPVDPYERPQGSACFIISVDDSIDDIWQLMGESARLFKFGSGVGADWSSLRSSKEKLSGGGTPSGPVSFMRVQDATGGTIKSGGKTRRAAIMQTLKVWHPDIMEFVEAKQDEERKAWALIEQGYDGSFNGPAYGSVAFQNVNQSVRVTDDFMTAAERGDAYPLRAVTTGQVFEEIDAAHVLHKIAEGTHVCGDPGVQYEDTIQRWHTVKNTGPINSSNPCVTGDTLVATEEGLRRIDSMLGETPRVVGLDRRLHRTTRVVETGVKPVYRLRTQAGYEVKLTADHCVWTENRGDVPAAKLTKNDVVRLIAPCFGTETLDADVAEYVGLMLGGGLDADTAARANPFMHFDEKRETLVLESAVARAASVVADRKLLEQYIVLDEDAATWRLTDLALRLDRDSMAALLRGFFTAKGEVGSSAVMLDSASEELLSQVQCLLLGFGIKSRLYRHRPTPRLKIEHAALWQFEREIDFLPLSVQEQALMGLNFRVESGQGEMSDAFDSLELLGEEPVYDLTEPATSHFVANGVAVHNCSEYMHLDNSACFAPETRVSTPHGLRTIESLYRAQEAGALVTITTELHSEQDHRRLLAYRPAVVTQVGVRPVLRMQLKDGRSIRVTEEHQFLTDSGQWKELRDLTPGKDCVQIRLTGDPVAFENDWQDVRRWQMIGWLTGDGVFSRGNVALTFGPQEEDTAAWMIHEFNGVIEDAYEWAEQAAPSRTCGLYAQESGVLQTTSKAEALVAYLEDVIGMKQATATDKDVPAAVHELPNDLKVAYLQGLFSAGGCIRNNAGATEKEVMLASSAPDLLRSVQLLLADLGITSRITWHHLQGRKNPQGQLHIYNQQARAFHALIGFPCCVEKQAEVRRIVRSPFTARAKNARPVGIVSITPDGEELVYDVTEPVTHSVIVEGMIAHNCNLASLNLRRFQTGDGGFDVERFRAATRIFITAMEILVDNAGYPSASIAKNSHDYRPLGLGFANLGALLMAMGLPYDSDEGRAVAGAVMAVEHAEAYARSAEIAANPRIGPFAGFAKNREPMLAVMQLHHDAVDDIHPCCPAYLREASQASADRMLALGRRHGYRNAQATVLAPTGTIAFMMDCDTTGVEPDIALVKYKLLAGKGDGMLKIVNQTVPEVLRHLGYAEDEVEAILAYVDEHDTIEGAPHLEDEHLPVFDCAFKPFKGTRSIHHEGHIKMMAACQPFISGAISKCVTGETLISTEYGLLPIGQFYEGEAPDSFRACTLKLASIDDPQQADLFYYGGVRQTIKLMLADGRTIEGTPNHRVKVANQDGYDWKCLREITMEDYVAIRLGTDMWAQEDVEIRFQPSPRYGGQKEIHIPERMSPVLGRFLGYYIAEGNMTRSNWTIRITNNHTAILERCQTIARDLFGLEGRIVTDARNGVKSFSVASKSLYELFTYLGCDGDSGTKEIPWSVLQSSRETVQEFIGGLWLDGYVRRTDGMTAICLKAERLIRQLQVVLNNFGIRANIIQKYNKKYDRTFYELCIHGRDVYRFSELFALDEPHKRRSLADAVAILAEKPEGAWSDVVPCYRERMQEVIYADHDTQAWRNIFDKRTQNVSRRTVVDFYKQYPLPELAEIVENDVRFVQVREITSGFAEVYDFQIPSNHAFLGNGIINHNTVNMPENATIEEIADAYAMGWRLGLKALAIYRENSKRSQPLSTSKGGNTKGASADPSGDGMAVGEPEVVEKIVYKPIRKRLPDERPALTHKFSIAGHEGYLHVGLYPDTHMPGEIFITMAKQGSTISGLMDAFATSVSIALQYGVPLEDLCSKFSYMRFEPSGFTNNRQIPMAKSVMDYIFRYLSVKFLEQHDHGHAPDPEQAVAAVVDRSGPASDETQMTLPFDAGHQRATVLEQTIATFLDKAEHAHARKASIHVEIDAKATFQNQEDSPPCSNCGAITVRSGACYVCTQCGSSSGCG